MINVISEKGFDVLENWSISTKILNLETKINKKALNVGSIIVLEIGL